MEVLKRLSERGKQQIMSTRNSMKLIKNTGSEPNAASKLYRNSGCISEG